jgi:AcrR family transcriptional regulator
MKSRIKKKPAAPTPIKASPRPRSRRKEARPQEIIEAGIAEFAERGYDGARLADVAKRAGVVKGTIYRYFADKHALFEAAVRSKVPPSLALMDQAVDSFSGTTDELITFMLHQVYSEIVDSESRTLMRIILSEGPRFPELAKLYYEATVGRGRPIVERIVARGVRRGEVRADHAKQIAFMIIAPTIASSIWKLTFEAFHPIATEELLEAHLELVRRGALIEK